MVFNFLVIHICNNKFTSFILSVTLTILFSVNILKGQIETRNTISIQATATVEEYNEMELITIHDMHIDQATVENGYITISPKFDPEAGKMLIKGKPNNKIRINYFNSMSLTNTLGKGVLDFNYVVSGYPGDNQNASMILDSEDPIITFNEDGEYYIWVGGKVYIKDAKPGNYLGKFTLQLENL